MPTDTDTFSAPEVKSEMFPLGPFPRNIWIHDNTPQDGLDKACLKIWKRMQSPLWGLHPITYLDPPGPPWSRNGAHSRAWLLDETEGLESIYKAVIRNRETEMKLRALCSVEFHAKSTITNLLRSASSPRSSKELEDSSTTGAGSMEGSKLGMPLLLKHTATAKGPGKQVVAEESMAVKEFTQNSMFSSAENSTAALTLMAESQTAGQEQQLPTDAKICSRPGSKAATEALQNPVTTVILDKKNVKYNASTFTPRFSATKTTITLNQPVQPRLRFPPLPLFPNHTNFPLFQGPYHQQARIPFRQALYRSIGCYPRQRAPFTPQQMFQLHCTPLLSYVPVVQPGFPYQSVPPQLPTSIQDPPPAHRGIQYPYPPPYRFDPAHRGPARPKHHYFSSGISISL